MAPPAAVGASLVGNDADPTTGDDHADHVDHDDRNDEHPHRCDEYHAGTGTGIGKDHTIFAKVDGKVAFVARGPKNRTYVDVVAA